MTAPSIKQIGTYTAGASLSVTVPWPTHAVGDLGILIVTGARNSGSTTIAGWTAISSRAFTGSNVSDNGITCFYRIATSSSESSPTFTHSTGPLGGRIITFKDFDSSTPIEAAAKVDSPGGSVNTQSINGITTTINNALVVLAFADSYALAANNVLSVNNGFSLDADAFEGSGNGFGQYVATKVQTTAGATGTTSFDFDVNSTGAAVKFAIRPSLVSSIAGTSSSALTGTGTLIGGGALVGSSSQTQSNSASLIGYGAMLANVSNSLSTNAALSGTGALVGSSTSGLTVAGTGAALTDSLLSANISLSLSAQGTLRGAGSLASAVNNVLNTSAALTGAGKLSALTATTLTASGALSSILLMQGTSVSALTTTATLSGSFTFGGNSFSTLSTTATLRGLVNIAGTSNSVLTTYANGTATSPIRGTSSSVLTTLSTLRSIPNPSISSNWRNLWLNVYNTRQILMNKIMGLTKVTLDSQSTAITSLQSAITHPTTGLEAQATAISTLQTRVTATESAITSQSSSITALTSSLADKASVSAVSSLITRVATLESEFNINLLLNPSLSSNDNFWDVNRFASGGILADQFLADRDYGAVPKPAGKHILYMQTLGTFPMGARGISYLERLRCLPDTDYIYSGWGAQDRLGCGDLRIFFFDASGAYISEANVYIATSGTVYTGGTDLANWKRVYLKVTSPSNAAFMQVAPNLWSDGVANANARWFDLMLERAAPGQTTPSPFNRGSVAAWAEWSLKFDVNGYISGMNFTSDGNVSNFIINADKFQVLKPGGGPSLTWSNGRLWNKGTGYSVIFGQDMSPSEDVILWIGPNPTSPEAALKDDAAFFVDESGNAFFRGTVHQSLLSGSALELGSTRIHTGGGRLAPFTAKDFAYKGAGDDAGDFSATVTLEPFQSPNVGTGYHHKRVSRLKADAHIECVMHGDGSGGENVFIDVQYNGGAWTTIVSRSGINVDYRGAWTFLIRYTTLETWDTVAFRARTNNGNTICLAFTVTFDNTFETGNAPGSMSGLDAIGGGSTGGGGGAPPPAGGGGGGGGSYCLVADMTYLPDGTMLKDSGLGTKILCWDGNLETPGTKYQTLRKMPMGQEECFLVTTANGAQVPQSVSTPTLVQDGRMVRTPNLLGEVVLTNLQGDLLWSEVISVEALGIRDVVKPDLADHVFFAGLDPAATIATHNLRDKGSEP